MNTRIPSYQQKIEDHQRKASTGSEIADLNELRQFIQGLFSPFGGLIQKIKSAPTEAEKRSIIMETLLIG